MAAEDTLISPGEDTVANAEGQSRTALASIAAATLLVVLKLGTGILTGSLGLISAGIESSGDVVAAVLTFLAIRLGGRPPDADHPYGHRRAENLGALGEAAILAGGGVFIVIEAIGQLTQGSESLDGALVRLRRHRRGDARRRVPDRGLGAHGPPVPVGGAALQRVSLRGRHGRLARGPRRPHRRRRRVRGRRRRSGPRRCLHHLRRRGAAHLRERARADGHRAHRRPGSRRAGHQRPGQAPSTCAGCACASPAAATSPTPS